MSEAPSMPMFWDAYIADTTHLSTEEHGAYLLLLAAMWRRGGCVPDDDKDTARILGLTKAKWLKIKARLLLPPISLIIVDGEVSQKKLQKTWKKTQEKIEKNRENGAKGGRPKSSENKDIAKANGSVSVNPNESIPEPEPEPIKKDTNVSQKKSTRGTRLSVDWVLPSEWGEWALSEGWPEPAIRDQADRFRDYWISKPGQKGVKLDWLATWRNWMRDSNAPKAIKGGQNGPASKSEQRLHAFVAGARGAS